jgi:hypothetical protein
MYHGREHYVYSYNRKKARQQNWLVILLCIGVLILLLDGGGEDDNVRAPQTKKAARTRRRPLAAQRASPLEKDLAAEADDDAGEGGDEEAVQPNAERRGRRSSHNVDGGVEPVGNEAATLHPDVVDNRGGEGHGFRFWSGGGQLHPPSDDRRGGVTQRSLWGDVVEGIGRSRTTPAPPTAAPKATVAALSHNHLAIRCEHGQLLIQLHGDKAPKTAAHVLQLVHGGAYTAATFYRFERHFVPGRRVARCGEGR